ncbi:MAG: DUF6883 domain-containing protein [Hyphomicrobiaceae bacterium]
MAKLPNIDAAVVEDAKLIDYLLNPAHPRGAAKARFLASFGFSSARPDEARAAFLEHARQHDVSGTQNTPFGTIYEIDGALPTPDGRDPVVRVVWMQDIGAAAPRLITMIPRPGRSTRRSP